jgi:GNAT superfamily N-acetyltransferase
VTDAADYRPPPLARLGEGHDVTSFDSGETSLDSWLREHAARTARRNLGATHVWANPGGRVTAYVTLASGLIVREDLPKALGHGYTDRIPATLIARLALDKTLQGAGLGGVLLTEALQMAAAGAVTIAAAFVVVDALHDQAIGFYQHHGFTLMPGTSRLALKVASIPPLA